LRSGANSRAAIARNPWHPQQKPKIELLAGIGMAGELAHMRFGLLGSGQEPERQ